MNLVIPLKTGTQSKEVIYAIRSFQKHIIGISGLIILGEKDNRLKDVKYIKCKEDKLSQFKERNIYRKILSACISDEVSENFVFANDDHFLLKDYDVNKLPYYYKGELYESMKITNPGYRKSLNHTRRHLMNNNYPTKDFDVHFPIVYNKNSFICTQRGIDWDKEYGYVIKSLYANTLNIEGEQMNDCKIKEKLTYNQIKERLNNRDWFSTADHAINDDMIKFLEETYPNKSKYEK